MLKNKTKIEKMLDAALPLDRWAGVVFANAKFIDPRLKARLIILAKTLAKSPVDSIPKAAVVWGQTKAAYNFLGNKRVCCEQIIEALRKSTAELCLSYDAVLHVQDTSTLSFPNAEKTEGLGYLYGADSRGLHFHTSLAMSESGLPIGIFGMHIWARDYGEYGKKRDRKNKPMEEKESYKWRVGVESAREAMRYISAVKKVKVIHVGDRENDISEVLCDIVASGDGCVIRSSSNRRVYTEQGASVKAHDYVHGQKPAGAFLVEVPRKQGQKERMASVTIRSCAAYLDAELTLKINLVEVLEETPPADAKEPLKWHLWTTEKVDTADAIIRVVNIYKVRWGIEEYHKTLKSGCRIESLQLKTAEQLKNALTIYAAVAVRILQLTKLSHHEPDAPCTQIFTQDEWQALYTYVNKKPPDAFAPIPTVRQAHLWVGRLGGHLGRKGDGLPGPKTTWIGWRELMIATDMYIILRNLRT